MRMKLGIIMRQAAAEWHGGMGSALYAVSRGEQGHETFLLAAEELRQALGERGFTLEEEEGMSPFPPGEEGLYQELRDMGAMGYGFCGASCMDASDVREEWTQGRLRCRFCGESLPDLFD